MTEPSPVRAALDELLSRHPGFDLVSIEWQVLLWGSRDWGGPRHTGPWVLIRLGQPSEAFDTLPAWALWEYAIWKRTGALHRMNNGAVSDDPIWTP